MSKFSKLPRLKGVFLPTCFFLTISAYRIYQNAKANPQEMNFLD